jgi:hypothetical protein
MAALAIQKQDTVRLSDVCCIWKPDTNCVRKNETISFKDVNCDETKMGELGLLFAFTKIFS